MECRLIVQRLSDDARLPCRASALAAGYDVFSAVDTVVPPRGRACVRTDLCIAVPSGTYGRITSLSGLAAKHFVDVGAGVVDADYRGNVTVLLFNHDEHTAFDVRKGDRIAQLVIEEILTPEVEEVGETPNQPEKVKPPPPPGYVPSVTIAVHADASDAPLDSAETHEQAEAGLGTVLSSSGTTSVRGERLVAERTRLVADHATPKP